MLRWRAPDAGSLEYDPPDAQPGSMDASASDGGTGDLPPPLIARYARPMSGIESFQRALEVDDLGEVERWIARVGVNVDVGFGDWPLHLAARYGSEKVMRRLLDAGAEIDPRDGADRTPLMVAAEEGQAGTVELLLAAGADPNASAGGFSVLERAMQARVPRRGSRPF